ncbi:hypothetical protein CSUI_010883 [Cystoisospora suis]|uniref:Transmembrane protein n=1 Tax=Cystoisospora suis TaxID=483139 RepID=A0A2C6KFQ7_9APIC|nr:hypothetical protein CSUI_010883 [Cystoisospora suis]
MSILYRAPWNEKRDLLLFFFFSWLLLRLFFILLSITGLQERKKIR